MKEINRTIIPIKSGYEARALCWHGNEIVDWAGIIRYQVPPLFAICATA